MFVPKPTYFNYIQMYVDVYLCIVLAYRSGSRCSGPGFNELTQAIFRIPDTAAEFDVTRSITVDARSCEVSGFKNFAACFGVSSELVGVTFVRSMVCLCDPEGGC